MELAARRVESYVLDHNLLTTWFISKKLLKSAQLCGCQSYGG